jgi:hypothetical protein
MQKNLRRVFILVTPRSGSSLLADLMRIGRHKLVQSRLNPKHEQLTKKTCLDFIYFLETGGLSRLLLEFYQSEQTCLISYLKKSDFRFIYLTRRNGLKQLISGCQAGASGVWHSKDTDVLETEVVTSVADVKKRAINVLRSNALAEFFFECFGIQPLRLYYERDLESRANWQGLRHRIENFLGDVKHSPISEHRVSIPWSVETQRKKIAGPAREEFYQTFLRRTHSKEVTVCQDALSNITTSALNAFLNVTLHGADAKKRGASISKS